MSGLVEVLSGRRPIGAYRWESNASVDDVRDTVEHAGWRFAHLEGRRIETAAEFHVAIAEALGLPDYYGRNLDALADCLGDVAGSQLLLWDVWSVLADREPRLFATAVELLGSALALVLRGDGADLGLHLLD
ncbi:MAG: barstar family protein [Nocardioides sp.]